MENIEELNLTRLNDLSIQEIKAAQMFKHFSDKEAEEVIRTLKRFSEIIVDDHFKKEKKLTNLNKIGSNT